MIKRLFLVSMIGISLVCNIYAVPVSLQRATEVADRFLQLSSPAGPNRAPARARLAGASAPQSKYYVFENEAGGFVIVAGDDVAYPILGYSNDAQWNTDDVPSHVQAWLDGYSKQIQWAQDNDIQPDSTITNAWKHISSRKKATVLVSPLLLTNWNQSPYYNDLCPLDTKVNKKAVVGCVATAMAQVLKYWNAPTSGFGSHTYTHPSFGTLSADFEHTTYDWANMPNALSSTSSAAQVKAVAQLMYHCGVSVEMDYGVESSGSYTISAHSNLTHCAEYALETYWGYDPALQGVLKSKYTDIAWSTLLCEELDAHRPVIYSGQGSGGGHCFVCDGYDADKYFHFNWGWGGLYDGYFKLDALAPGTGGIGSGSGSYNNEQQMIIGVQPDKRMTPSTNTAITYSAALSMPTNDIAPSTSFSVDAKVINKGSNFTGDIALALLDRDLELVCLYDQRSAQSIAAGKSASYTFNASLTEEICAGTYYVAVFYKPTGKTNWTTITSQTYKPYLQMSINGGSSCISIPYQTGFEVEPTGWVFATAPGIPSGFTVGTATKNSGAHSLYMSADGGATQGFKVSPNGFTSLAYKKIYLERGTYIFHQRLYTKLSDTDRFLVGIVPTSNGVPKPLAEYATTIVPLDAPLRLTGNYDYTWYDHNEDFIITENGYYYLIYALPTSAVTYSNQQMAIDDIRIERQPDMNISYKETKEGVLVTVMGDYESYNIGYYSIFNYSTKYLSLDANNQVLIPYSKLRDATYGLNIYNITIKGICNGKSSNSQLFRTTLNTDAFPEDTCIAVPCNFTAHEEDSGVRLTWNGQSTSYQIKWSRHSNTGDTDQSYIIQSGITDTTTFIPFGPKYHLLEGNNYFFVRGICPNDTSIWQTVSINIKGCDSCCLARPDEVYTRNTSQGVELTWSGNAPEYIVEYWPLSVQNQIYWYEVPDSCIQSITVSDTICVVPYSSMSDVIYKFQVRAICAGDTSLASKLVQAYNINFGEDYCIPFYDFYGRYTQGTYGSYSNPYSNKGIIDYGNVYRGYNGIYGYYTTYEWDSYDHSSHTIMYTPGQTDANCSNQLLTIPKGEKYSIRLGNDDNADGESITYTHKIDSGYPLILLLKYAVVLQDPSHTPDKNPHFTLEILDENDVALDPICWYADFAADKNAVGWNSAPNDVVWKDWTTIGVNLTELSKYGDRIIKIRLTTNDCALGQHFGYAYFTLSCTTGDMQGMSCGVRPNRFEVAEGFKYNWYLMDDTTKTMVCDSNVFIVQSTDTNSYYVDMISLENEDCYYTLKAYTLPRLPRPQASFIHTPNACTNEVTIRNSSYVYKIMLDGTEQRDGRIQIDSILWDLGPYGTSTDWEPQLVVPNEGDTFKITLHTLANACHASQEYTLEIPSIVAENGYTYKYICEGDTVHYQGQTFTQTGTYILDTALNSVGCDSISYLVLDYTPKDTILLYDTVCFNMLPYDFYGQSCTQTGSYQHIIYTSTGCDSAYYLLNLHIYQRLDAEINPVSEICSGEPSFDLSYNTLSDASLEFSVIFSDLAKAAGFVDTTGYTDSQGMFTIHLPENVLPNTYTAEVTIDNHGCEMVTLPITIPVLYSSQIIIQRWNDLLAVSKSIANSYQGFYQYQWYFNGTPIEGETGTYYYNPNGLQMDGFYQVELTRHQDSTVIISCPYMPELHPDTQTLVVQPTALAPTAPMQITAPEAGEMHIICNTGYSIGKSLVQAGDNTISAPAASGLYFIHLTTQDGQQYVQKIIVY